MILILTNEVRRNINALESTDFRLLRDQFRVKNIVRKVQFRKKIGKKEDSHYSCVFHQWQMLHLKFDNEKHIQNTAEGTWLPSFSNELKLFSAIWVFGYVVSPFPFSRRSSDKGFIWVILFSTFNRRTELIVISNGCWWGNYNVVQTSLSFFCDSVNLKCQKPTIT